MQCFSSPITVTVVPVDFRVDRPLLKDAECVSITALLQYYSNIQYYSLSEALRDYIDMSSDLSQALSVNSDLP